jgi:hypothetical protein
MIIVIFPSSSLFIPISSFAFDFAFDFDVRAEDCYSIRVPESNKIVIATDKMILNFAPQCGVCQSLLLFLIAVAVSAHRVQSFSAVPSFPFFGATSSKGIFGKTNAPPGSQVIEAAKKLMDNQGYFDPIDESLFAEEFIFRGPVIGPLNKADYMDVLDYFKIYMAFPDIDPNCFGYTVDPEDPYRVWFFLRAKGTYQNPLGGPLGSIIKPKNQVYRGSLETWSLVFDEDLKCRLMTAGYVSDRFDAQTTTNGVGLTFGILETLGLSIPNGPGNLVLRIVQAFNGPLVQLKLTPKAVSDPSEIPDWFKSDKRGADP